MGSRDDRGREASQDFGISDRLRPGVGAVEHVFLEARLLTRQLLHQGAKAQLALGVERHAGKAKVAQRIVDELALRRVQGLAVALQDRGVGPIQRLVLPQLGLVLADEGQAGVIGSAQLGRIRDRVEVAGR